jgi:glycerol-3-phosphate dehydrogenase
MIDLLIIGAGIVGCQLAYDLSHFKLSVCVLEKNVEIMNETSSANSALIHAGYDPEDDTLKAKLNLIGAKRYPQLCKELNTDYQAVGSLLVAMHEEELTSLNELYERAIRRSVPVQRLNKEEVIQREPNINPNVIEALFFPTTAIITPWQMGVALMNHAVLNGVELRRNEAFASVVKEENHYRVMTNKGTILARHVINAAGLQAHVIAKHQNAVNDFPIQFRKGEYQVSDLDDEPYLNHIIYPCPSIKGKGVLALKTIEGNLMFGPTSTVIEDPYDHGTTQMGLDEIDVKIAKLIKPLPKSHMIRQFAGVRPSPVSKDFILKEDAGWFDCVGIDSPGLASAPGISEYVIENFVQKYFELIHKEQLSFKWPHRIHPLDEAKRQAMIQTNPRMGKIVCVCETVSEQEIVDAIHLPVGARSVKGVKRLTRPGSGRCQGGFCETAVVSILARELKVHPSEVPYDNETFLMPYGVEHE